MALTIKAAHEAVMATGDSQRAMAYLVRRCVGSTSSASDQRVPWIGKHLILVAWDFGGKDVGVLGYPRYNEPDEVRTALRGVLASIGPIDRRITGSKLAALIATLRTHDENWPTYVREAKEALTAHGEAVAKESAQRAQQRDEEIALIRRLLFMVSEGEASTEIRFRIDASEVATAQRMLKERKV
jgi:hypothetical protein